MLGCAASSSLHRIFSRFRVAATLVGVRGLLIAVASFVVESGLEGVQASAVVVHGLSGPVACWIFLD